MPGAPIGLPRRALRMRGSHRLQRYTTREKNDEQAEEQEIRGANTPAPEKPFNYGKEMARLQVEIAHLQSWVKATGARIIILFEGRSAAGKGGVIKRLTGRVSPRVFRVDALPSPFDREKSQMYFQRYMPQFPAAGEIVIFDRSWYNRPGVERVKGFTP